MLTYLAEFSSLFSPFNVFRYITFRTGGATATALLFVFWFGPAIISALRLKQGKGQPIREDGPQSHLLTKRGTPTMGGLMILSGTLVATLLWANPRNLYVWVRDLRDARLRRHRLLRRLSQGDEAVAQGLLGKSRLALEAAIAITACIMIAQIATPASRTAWRCPSPRRSCSISAGSISPSRPS
jgi:phospho-N-acetylmuramoyl-pentapeptide-transferase